MRTFWLFSNCGNGWLNRGFAAMTQPEACELAGYYAEHASNMGRFQIRCGDINSSFPRNIVFETL